MVSGALLALTTWVLAVALLASVGLLLGTRGSRNRLSALRRSLWWGLAVATALVLAVSLSGPLARSFGLFALLGIGLASAGFALKPLVRLPVGLRRPRLGEWLAIGSLLAAVAYLALAVLGPVTNYDSGLYHLGALRYQQEVGLVPGIANLYFPLGYGNSVIPWSAFIGSTPWGDNGYRLFNGFLLALLATETIIRLLQRRRTPGTYLLFLALLFAWIPMVALSDYWVTSPTSDSSVLILTTVSAAYLADAVHQSRRDRQPWANLSVAVVLGWVLVSMRPTMVVFAAAVFAIAVLITLRGRSRSPRNDNVSLRMLSVTTLATGLVLGVTQVLRDRMLSGWLQYPLSVFAFDVPWLAPNPSEARTATLGAARDAENLWVAAESWGWIPSWIGRLPSQWEFWLTILLALASVALVYLANRGGRGFPWRSAALATAPSALAVLAWFVASPPAFRFIWGPLFTLTALPGAFAACSLAARARPPRFPASRTLAAAIAVPLLIVTAFSAATRFDFQEVTSSQVFVAGPISIPYTVAEIPKPEVAERVLPSGLTVLIPVESDQCWAVYPLCAAQLLDSVALLDEDWQEGFRH